MNTDSKYVIELRNNWEDCPAHWRNFIDYEKETRSVDHPVGEDTLGTWLIPYNAKVVFLTEKDGFPANVEFSTDEDRLAFVLRFS